jgi:hypothetical protein
MGEVFKELQRTKTEAKANAGILRFAQNDKSSWWWQVRNLVVLNPKRSGGKPDIWWRQAGHLVAASLKRGGGKFEI